MGSENQDISVMVIGAGTGGRLIAQGMRKAGIPCTVFEQDESLDQRERDWDFGIYWAQTPLEACLPADVSRERILSTQVDDVAPAPDASLPMFNAATGALLHRVPTPYYLRLQRREFSRLLGAGIDVRYNKRLVSIDATGDGVTASFADGSQHSATVLVGAEGARSLTRSYLLGPERGAVLRSPIVMAGVLTRLPSERVRELRELHHRVCTLFHPEGMMMWVGVHDGRGKGDDQLAEIEYLVICSWRQEGPVGLPDSRSIIREMKRRASGFAHPFAGVVGAIDEERKAWANYLTYWPTQGWEDHPARGKVTLAGDAAHPMTPHRGQGLNNAILDCNQFIQQVEAMPERTAVALREAVVRYETEVVDRGRDAVLSSLENSLMVHDWDRLMQSHIVRVGVTKQRVDEEKGEKGEGE